MKKRTRALALLLTLLTLVGLVPFAVFADSDATLAADSTETEETVSATLGETLNNTAGATVIGGFDLENSRVHRTKATLTSGYITKYDEATGKYTVTPITESTILGISGETPIVSGMYLPDYLYNWVDEVYTNKTD